MNTKKTVYGEIEKGYAINTGIVDGRRKLFFAAENDGPCKMYDFETKEETSIWDGPGGTMNIVTIPGKEDEFFATQKFLPVFAAPESIVVHAKYIKDKKEWEINKVLDLPYLHRFDVIESNGKLYFVGCTLCQRKEFVQDWSTAGSIYTCIIPPNYQDDWNLKEIFTGITKNHGYELDEPRNRFLVSGVEGMFEVKIPQIDKEEFIVNKLIDREISDMAVLDIDGDGQLEIATIEMFHGNELAINKMVDGEYKKVFTHPINFGHVIWGGTIKEKPVFIVGGRREELKIEIVTFEKGKYIVEELDRDMGPSQLFVFEHEGREFALSANREANQLASYEFI